MTRAAFAHFARTAARLQREPDAYWHREGQAQPDPIELSYVATSTGLDAEGFTVQDPEPVARVRVAEVLRVAPDRLARGMENAFRNDGRDKIVVRGRSHDVESCSHDGHEWLVVRLVRRS